MIVVSDTSPICYLLLIEEIDLLPQLYKQVYIPQAVQQELVNNRFPAVVKAWIEHPPEWLVICSVEVLDANLAYLDPGERAVIALAEEQGADLVIVDDGLGRRAARTRQLKVTGLLGVLDTAAQQNLVNFPVAISRLQQTTFRVSRSLIESLLQQYQLDDKRLTD